MSLIIKNAVIIDGQTGPAAVKQDLQIEDGKVKKIGVGLDGKESIDVNGEGSNLAVQPISNH